MLLYRPVGLAELRLIYESGLRAFPPRLPDQPIFYPVLNAVYAAQIAMNWNTKSAPFAGYVTQFTVDDAYVSRFEPQIVGSRIHEELWVPAEELDEFNRHIAAPIVVCGAFFGAAFIGYVPDRGGMMGRDAVAQLDFLAMLRDYNGVDFMLETRFNHLAVFLHYPFWQQRDFGTDGVDSERKARLMADIAEIWREAFPDRPLPELA